MAAVGVTNDAATDLVPSTAPGGDLSECSFPNPVAQAFYKDIPTFLGFSIRGFIWDITILIFADVLFGPYKS